MCQVLSGLVREVLGQGQDHQSMALLGLAPLLEGCSVLLRALRDLSLSALRLSGEWGDREGGCRGGGRMQGGGGCLT